MGICESTMTDDESRAAVESKKLDKMNERDFENDSTRIKLLLLGAGESGKSTVFKQMKLLYGVGYTEEDKRSKTPVIYNNVILGMKTLIEQARTLGHDIKATSEADSLMDLSPEAEVDESIGAMVKTLWADEGIQLSFRDKSKFQLIDSVD